jgi:hypothetical protein
VVFRTRIAGRPALAGLLLTLMATALACIAPSGAQAAVSVSRADLSAGTLRIEGTAVASRDITVDGPVLGRSDSSGRFKLSKSSYTAPADCTVDVNDGSASPRVATLSGCTVSTAPPPASAGPPAPAPLTPAAGATVTNPFTISWSPVSDPWGLLGYNWEVSATPTFATSVLRNSVNDPITQDTVSGLPDGTYYWRVQAVNGNLAQGAWSAPRSFIVSGTSPNAPGAPVFEPLTHGTQYHPMESFPIQWSAVPGAASYVVEASRNAAFPEPAEVRFDNIPVPRYGLTFHNTLQGNWNVRVYAVNADGVRGRPSNVRTFSISYTAPVGPAPTLAAPADGAALTLPIKLDWNDVANPQDTGYEAQVSSSSTFSSVEVQISGQTSSDYTLVSLSPGTKYWRVRHFQGDASATTAAPTAWSVVRSFTVSSAPAQVASVSLTRPSGFSGEEIVGEVQLTSPAPAGGAVVQLSSTHPTATPLPASVTVPAGLAWTQFRFDFGQVTAPAPARITAMLGASSAGFDVTVNPPQLRTLQSTPSSVSGGTQGGAFLQLDGAAPTGGAVVQLSSSSPLARPPATITVPAGNFSWPISIETSAVDTDTPVTITATWKGKEVQSVLTLMPGVAPDVLTVDPATVTGGDWPQGRVALAAPATRDVQISLTSSDPAIARVPPTVTITTNSPHAGFLVQTTAPTVQKVVTITATGGGVTKTATLTVNPVAAPPPAPLAAPTLLTPASGARVAPGPSVAFDWGDVARAASYRLQVSSASTFATTVVDRVVTASQVATALTATGDRFWRVRATDAAGTAGAWSAARSFRVK